MVTIYHTTLDGNNFEGEIISGCNAHVKLLVRYVTRQAGVCCGDHMREDLEVVGVFISKLTEPEVVCVGMMALGINFVMKTCVMSIGLTCSYTSCKKAGFTRLK